MIAIEDACPHEVAAAYSAAHHGAVEGVGVEVRETATIAVEAADMTTATTIPAPPEDYESFLARKAITAPSVGIASPPELSARLFEWQRLLTSWALRKGRAALFADTGLGKGWMTLEWARVVAEHTGLPVLILAPLAVSQQFVREGVKFGVAVTLCATADDVRPGVNVTNYQKLHKFDGVVFGGVALDESSILKAFNGKTRNALIERFAATPFRLCGTATPSPNDHTEIGNTAEFLGVMTRTEMLSEFFTHDGGSTQDWRLKGHAVDAFWTWVASWAASLRRPSDIGFDDGAYDLPPLRQHQHVIPVDQAQTFARGLLFAEEAATLSEQRAARRASMDTRVAKAAELATATTGPVLVWCELNDEGDALEEAIPGAVQIAGATPDDEKEKRMVDFSEGRIRVLVTKSSLAGFGLNWQHVDTQVFVGATHSFEGFYQSVRRSWRFGRVGPVDVHVICSEADGRVVDNLKRKQAAAEAMAGEMAKRVSDVLRAELTAQTSRMTTSYEPRVPMTVPTWVATGAT